MCVNNDVRSRAQQDLVTKCLIWRVVGAPDYQIKEGPRFGASMDA